MSNNFTQRTTSPARLRLKARTFLKRGATAFFATSALMLPIVIPAQVLVTDAPAETTLGTISGALDTANGFLGDIDAEINGSFASLSAEPPFVSTATLVPSPAAILDASAYVTQACGPEALLSAASISVEETPPPTISVVGGAALPQICASIIMYRVQAYNDTVAEMQRIQEVYIPMLAALQVKADAGYTAGASASITAQATTIMADLQVEEAYWKMRKESFNMAINYLQEEQNTLTRSSMQGSISLSSLVSAGVQTAALKLGLDNAQK